MYTRAGDILVSFLALIEKYAGICDTASRAIYFRTIVVQTWQACVPVYICIWHLNVEHRDLERYIEVFDWPWENPSGRAFLAAAL